VHVVERGSGVPLVLIHGFAVDHRLLLPLDPAIQAAGNWRRLYLDLPGHGASPDADVASAEDVVVVVEQGIRDRVGQEPFAILGSSFGAMVARRVAHDFRDQVLGLAALAPLFVAAHADRDVPASQVLREDPGVLHGLGADADAYAEQAVIRTAQNARAFLDHVQPGLLAGDQEAMARISSRYALNEEPEDVSLARFEQPSLFVTGRQDHVVGYRDAWARFEHYPRASFVVLDGAGHNLHLEQPEVVAALVTDWLRRAADTVDR
jgi:pimeloyl-ACP methyl ester carboxylesterase